MVFYNKKEEVLEIELTPYGKHLLSKGGIEPKYYEFYDDDVLYDSQYGGLSEKQEQAQERIKQTPRTKVQYTFEGADKRYKEYIKQVKEKGTLDIPIIEKRKNLLLSSLPLANMSVVSEKLPATTLKILNGEIESRQNTISRGIPRGTKQIQIKPKSYNLKIVEKNPEQEELDLEIFEQEDPTTLITRYISDVEKTETVLQNNNLVEITSEVPYILIDIEETEIDIQNDNFEIFLYEIEEKNNGNETYEIEKQIMFVKERDYIVDNRYVENIDDDPIRISREMAEQFFTIQRDKEIPDNILCKNLTDEQISALNQIDGYNINCENVKRLERKENKELLTDFEELEEC